MNFSIKHLISQTRKHACCHDDLYVPRFTDYINHTTRIDKSLMAQDIACPQGSGIGKRTEAEAKPSRLLVRVKTSHQIQDELAHPLISLVVKQLIKQDADSKSFSRVFR